MALTDTQRAFLRRLYYKIRPQGFTGDKPDLDAISDALDARYQADKAAWAADMEAAAPGLLDATEKKRYAAVYFRLRFSEDFV